MRALTTEKERQIRYTCVSCVRSRVWRSCFSLLVTSVIILLLVPQAAPLVAMFMLGNLFRESKVVDRLTKAAQNELLNLATNFSGDIGGRDDVGREFPAARALLIFFLGLVAFIFSTTAGLLLAKFMNLFLKAKINPLIGSAGSLPVPMAARVSQTVGLQASPTNHLLMHAMVRTWAG